LSREALAEVLLATYNGERFLRDQIDSILAQDYANFRVLARDDGSADATVSILNEYQKRFPGRFQVLPAGVVTGSAKDNFLLLLGASQSSYVFFSDQDDVWLPRKVSMSMQSMSQLEAQWGSEIPLLVFTDLRVVDEQLRTLHESFWKHEKLKPARVRRFGALLAQNVVTGCTVMLNRRLAELALRMPSEAYMHDQWVGLLASAMGKAIALETPTVLYRQHGRNVVGSKPGAGSLSGLLERIRNGGPRRIQWKISQRQAESFLRVYQSEISVQNKEILSAYLRCGKTKSRILRTYLLIRHGFLRTGVLERLATLTDQWIMPTGENG
jgi:hypothetical protein